ncbi:unnamed protein product [Arabidopsis lyrata]|uniref:Uncharacterized protein n=1 Tax=Arabidopsis lyrata subsp. lyrata TaxID=81972 RepID=D7LT60_ARALL|nr:hypothetical protein ARALYDRAFT_907815 [Arabidopsis lyrata subsp. lyrata]CAH8257103.1 unnamed protein product [Arabidopsis lyrata]
MIESSYLANKRHVRYPSPKLLVLRSEISSDRCSRTILLETISKDHRENNKIFICSYKFPSYPHSEYHFNNLGRIAGYCDGLVCIYQSENIYIINPTTRKLRILSSNLLQKCTCLPVKTEVFNLNNGEQRCICFPILFNELGNDKTSIFANGSLYWQNIYNLKIAAFDLHTEMFSEVLPPSWYTSYSCGVYLWSLKDRLCLSDVLQYPDVDIWGLQQEGPNVMKWEKILSVTILSMDCLDPNFWKLGLAACYFRPIGQKPSRNFLEKVPADQCSTTLYMEDLVSSV